MANHGKKWAGKPSKEQLEVFRRRLLRLDKADLMEWCEDLKEYLNPSVPFHRMQKRYLIEEIVWFCEATEQDPEEYWGRVRDPDNDEPVVHNMGYGN